MKKGVNKQYNIKQLGFSLERFSTFTPEEKVREPIVKKLYNLDYLIENLGNDHDLNTVLNN